MARMMRWLRDLHKGRLKTKQLERVQLHITSGCHGKRLCLGKIFQRMDFSFAYDSVVSTKNMVVCTWLGDIVAEIESTRAPLNCLYKANPTDGVVFMDNYATDWFVRM